MKQKIELIDLDTLLENPLNPKEHDEALMSKSIEAFGYVEPIVIDGRTGYMISGHGRAKVLRSLFKNGNDVPNGITVKDGKWLVPVITGWASANDTEASAALVALNRTTEKGGWNDTNLFEILNDLADNSDLLDVVGYSKADLVILEKTLEAQAVFTTDLSDAIDEFLDNTGIDRDGVVNQFSSAIKVFFLNEEARQEFFDAIGYTNEPEQKMINYPKSYVKRSQEKWFGDGTTQQAT